MVILDVCDLVSASFCVLENGMLIRLLVFMGLQASDRVNHAKPNCFKIACGSSLISPFFYYLKFSFR